MTVGQRYLVSWNIIVWPFFRVNFFSTDSLSISRDFSIDFLLAIRLLFIHFPRVIAFSLNGEKLPRLNYQQLLKPLCLCLDIVDVMTWNDSCVICNYKRAVDVKSKVFRALIITLTIEISEIPCIPWFLVLVLNVVLNVIECVNV